MLFATDIAARGLDFPTIDWVLQASPAVHYAVTPFLSDGGRHPRSTGARHDIVLQLQPVLADTTMLHCNLRQRVSEGQGTSSSLDDGLLLEYATRATR